MRRRVFRFLVTASFVLCLGIAALWAWSEKIQTYIWAGGPNSSAMVFCTHGWLNIYSYGPWPTHQPWRFAAEWPRSRTSYTPSGPFSPRTVSIDRSWPGFEIFRTVG